MVTSQNLLTKYELKRNAFEHVFTCTIQSKDEKCDAYFSPGQRGLHFYPLRGRGYTGLNVSLAVNVKNASWTKKTVEQA